jgi:hypothetical protein
MDARKPSSKKWTAFPEEYLGQITNVFVEAFGHELGSSKLVVEGRIFPEEICLRVGYREPQSLRQNNFEISADFDPKTENAIEKIYACIDGAASVLATFFQSQNTDILPVDWKEFKYEKQLMYFQFSTVNTDLESEADRILGLTGVSLYNQEDEEDPEVLP